MDAMITRSTDVLLKRKNKRRLSQGYVIFESVVFFVKLKKVFRTVYLNRLVDCFWPSQSSVKKVRTVSELIDSISRSPYRISNLLRNIL